MGELVGIARFRINEGKLEEFKRLSAEAMEIVKAKDTGTVGYDTYFNEDESECVVFERFTNSQALIAHGENMAELSEKILATFSVEPTMSVKTTVASTRSSPFDGGAGDESLHLVKQRTLVACPRERIDPGELDEPRPGDPSGEVSAAVHWDVDVVRPVQHQRRDKDRGEDSAQVERDGRSLEGRLGAGVELRRSSLENQWTIRSS